MVEMEYYQVEQDMPTVALAFSGQVDDLAACGFMFMPPYKHDGVDVYPVTVSTNGSDFWHADAKKFGAVVTPENPDYDAVKSLF